MRIVLDARKSLPAAIRDIHFICVNHPGEHPVEVEVRSSAGPRTLKFNATVSWNQDMVAELQELPGVKFS